MLYLCLFLFFSGFSVYWYKHHPNKNSKTVEYTLFFFLILFVGLRYQVGGDWESYHACLANTKDCFKEPLFDTVIYIANFTHNPILILNVASSILFFSPIIWQLKKISAKTYEILFFISIFFPLGILLMGMGYVRQGIASSFLVCSLFFYFKDGWKVSGFLWLVAIGFHTSALVALGIPLFFIVNKFFSRHPIIVTSLTFVCGALSFLVASRLWPTYFDLEKNGWELTSKGFLFRVLYFYSVIFIAFYFTCKNFLTKNWIYTSILYFGLAVLGNYLISTHLDRVVILFSVPVLVFIILQLRKITDSNSKYLSAWLFQLGLAAMYLTCWLMLSQHAQKYWLPYRIWPSLSISY